ncbi:MAG: M4 family metallopeptidase, partial [Candidatus Eisenbacteria sp.]|nr:M4 family metallopeptidase [Candidatus Eisenbacteria bacterium]
PAIAAPLAASVAIAELNARDGVEGREDGTDLLIYPHDGELCLAWRVTVSAGITYRQEAFVDALSGEFLHAVSLVRYDGAVTGSGLDLVGQSQQLELWQAGSEYAMINTTKQMFNLAGSDMPNNPVGAVWILDANNTEGNQLTHVISSNQNDWTGHANAVSLATFVGYYYDYVLANFGRNSFDNAGRTIKAVVNFGQNMNNAFWNGEFAVFGNGDNNLLSDLAGAMDVVCHELGHAIDEHTANFVYEFQPGSIDESYADIFGSLVEWHIEGEQGDWLLAEDVYTPGTPGDAMRNMEDPSSIMVSGSDPYPSHMDQYWNLSADQDHGGVHINNMIPSLAFVKVSKAVGRDKAEQVWYWALCNCLNRNSQFVDLRLGAIQAAEQLYPGEPAVLQAVTDAFDDVGVEGTGGTPDPPDLPDNEGDNFLAIMDIATGIIYRALPDASSSAAIGPNHPMGGGGRPSFSDDGAWFVWVGEDKHIYMARSDGTDAEQLSADPEWWSVALSADARYLAATTFVNNGLMYVFDLVEPDSSKSYELYSQNDGGGTPSNVVYADVMEFTVEGDYILYDALNSAQIGGTTSYDYWDINMLRRADGTCFRVFQTLPQGQHIGNPTLAQNQDNLIAFDYIVADTVLVQACNLQTGEVGLVTNNYSILGRPTFSGDDGQIYYQYPVLCQEQYVDGVWKVSLEPNGITGAGDDAPWDFCSIGYPVWFTIGDRPAAVLLLALDGGWAGREVALQWQVADPGALSGFHVECGQNWEGPYERRTTEPIPAGAGNTYDFVDNVLATSDVLFYRVIGVQVGGMHTELGRLQILRGEANVGSRRPVLLPNAPNPFGEVTALRFVLPAVATSTRTSLCIYDLQGRLVARPVAGELLGAGEHRVPWEGRDLGGIPLVTGEYYMRLQIGGHLATGRISVIR